MERARAAGVPGAEVVAVGTHGAHAYAIHTRLPGVVGTKYTGDRGGVWHESGRARPGAVTFIREKARLLLERV